MRKVKAIEQQNSKEKSSFIGMRFGRLIRRRNEKQTCSIKCGQVIRKMHYTSERNTDGTFKKTKL